jgi:hypothetical protein
MSDISRLMLLMTMTCQICKYVYSCCLLLLRTTISCPRVMLHVACRYQSYTLYTVALSSLVVQTSTFYPTFHLYILVHYFVRPVLTMADQLVSSRL